MKKRVLALLLALLLVVGALPLGSAAAFSDVADATLTAKIDVLQMFGIVGGYPDGTYRPNNSLTRAEFTKLTVAMLDKIEAASSFGSFTIFGDVPGSHWAAAFINYASRELKLVNGYTDSVGSFRPENSISYAEAVTIIMRALGYTDADAGYNWPKGYMDRADALGLLDGIALNKDSDIDRGRAINRAIGAELFYNALYTAQKDGKKLIDGLVGTQINNALVVSLNATAADGTTGSVKIDGEQVVVKTAIALPASLVGRRADFSTNKSGEIIGYELLDQTRVTIAVNYCDSEKITALDGSTFKIPETVRIFDAADGLEGDSTTYSKIRASLSVGDGLELVYKPDGSLDYVLLLGSGSERGARVIGTTAAASGIFSALGAPSDAPIYKNGALITTAELRDSDVATYSPATGIISVCNFKLHGVYEFASPNTTAPTSITMHGNTFDLTSTAAASLADFKIGDYMTLLFTADGKIARAVKTTGANPVGLYTGKTVEFVNGPTLNMTFANISAGELVVVTASGNASRASGSGTAKTLNLSTNMLGDTELAPGCAFFERTSANSPLVAIDRTDITVSAVAPSDIAFVINDALGRPAIVALNDVTGDRYIYGELTGSVQQPADGAFDVAKYFITVKNADGSEQYQHITSSLPANGWGGVALDRDGKISATNTLTKYTGITRTDFIGSDSVMINGVEVQLPANVQIYLSATGKYMTDAQDIREKIADARAFGATFEVYMDKSPADGGKVRILIVK